MGRGKAALGFGADQIHVFSVIFNRIFVKLAGHKDRHKISGEFEFGLDGTFHYRVIRPWAFPLTLNLPLFEWGK